MDAREERIFSRRLKDYRDHFERLTEGLKGETIDNIVFDLINARFWHMMGKNSEKADELYESALKRLYRHPEKDLGFNEWFAARGLEEYIISRKSRLAL